MSSNDANIEESLKFQRETERSVTSFEKEDLLCNYFIEAGAGSGKTYLLTERIICLIASGTAEIDEICAITFNKKMALEFKNKLIKKLQSRTGVDGLKKGSDEYKRCKKALNHLVKQESFNKLDDCFLGTIDSFCLQFLQYVTGERFVPLAGNEEEELLERCIGSFEDGLGDRGFENQKKIDEYLSLCKRGVKLLVQNKGFTLVKPPEGLDEYYDNYISDIETIKEQYENLVEEERKIQFIDILIRVRDIIKTDATDNSGVLITKFRNDHKKKFFLLDEFQDTNPLQVEIFFYLTHDYDKNTNFEGWEQCQPLPGSLFIVGDPKQSIYHFRGADLESYLKVKEVFDSKKKGRVLYLTYNRRSNDELRLFFNECFDKLFDDSEPRIEYKFIPPLDRMGGLFDNNVFEGVYYYQAMCGKENKSNPDNKLKTNEAMIAQIISTIVDNDMYKIITDEDEEPRRISYGDICVIQFSRKNLRNTKSILDSCSIPSYLLLEKTGERDEIQSERELINPDSNKKRTELEAYELDERDTVEQIKEEEQKDDKVWLTTIHTSKGGEKPVVILGYSWPIEFRPTVVKDIDNSEWYLAGYYDFDGNPYLEYPEIEGIKEYVSLENKIKKQEMKNLVYVAATRAKCVLFVCDSKTASYEDKNRWAQLLSYKKQNRVEFKISESAKRFIAEKISEDSGVTVIYADDSTESLNPLDEKGGIDFGNN